MSTKALRSSPRTDRCASAPRARAAAPAARARRRVSRRTCRRSSGGAAAPGNSRRVRREPRSPRLRPHPRRELPPTGLIRRSRQHSFTVLRALLGGDGKLGDEGRATCSARLDPDATAHALEQLAADVQAEAGAADAAGQIGVEAIELLEDAAMLGGWNAQALVADREPQARPIDLDLHYHAAAVRRVLDRVVDEVRQDLSRLVRVSCD